MSSSNPSPCAKVRLDLSYNRFTSIGAKAVLKEVNTHRGLALDLGGNGLGRDVVRAVRAGLLGARVSLRAVRAGLLGTRVSLRAVRAGLLGTRVSFRAVRAGLLGTRVSFRAVRAGLLGTRGSLVELSGARVQSA